MSWPDANARNNFFKEAETMTYDFNHERKNIRKNIWSVFNFTEYGNLDKDIEFTVSSDKIYVITAYWVNDISDTIRAIFPIILGVIFLVGFLFNAGHFFGENADLKKALLPIFL